MERQDGANAPVGARIGAGNGVGAGVGVGVSVIQNAQRTLMDYAQPSLLGIESCIKRPTIESTTFELKHSYVTMIQNSIQFHGLLNEDPNLHIVNFLEICDMCLRCCYKAKAIPIHFKG